MFHSYVSLPEGMNSNLIGYYEQQYDDEVALNIGYSPQSQGKVDWENND